MEYDNCRVLVVDDMSTMRRIVISLLVELGFKKELISEADDGSTAIAFLEKNTVDFVVTDWNMPQVTGIDLLRHIRKTEATSKLPVLMVTAEAKREQIIEAAGAGVNNYVVKPFNKKTLGEKISKIFAGLSA
ncbi:response regulator [Pseudoalteromonas marina]|uniref:Response regulator n=1 Tax=Pseudoalteromonas marina TaxID=267375 RepID=A0ABT9FCX5_9GAMM|nr:response regulator [Pseudoalteromonas marina]MDP2564321.1 response regulator [Pseudoalteromonas marina]